METGSVFWEPEYVAHFRCDGKTCGSRCCQGWRIAVDDRARERYRAIPDAAVRQSVLDAIRYNPALGSHEFAIGSDGRCPFLRADWLCQLQRDLGEDGLTDICWQYPRVFYRFPDLIESALTISCPVAAALILREEPLRFHRIRRPLPPERTMLQPVPAVLALGDVVFSLQRAGITLLQDRRYPLDCRLLALYRLAARADAVAGCLDTFCRDASSPEFIGTLLAAPPPPFDLTVSLRWRVRLMGEIYEHPFSPEKTAALTTACAAAWPAFCRDVRQAYEPLLESYLVNEFFLRLYPFAFPGSFRRNTGIFLATGKLIETALLASYTQSGQLGRDAFFSLLVRVAGHLDHNTLSMRRVGAAVDNIPSASPALLIDRSIR